MSAAEMKYCSRSTSFIPCKLFSHELAKQSTRSPEGVSVLTMPAQCSNDRRRPASESCKGWSASSAQQLSPKRTQLAGSSP